MDSTSFLTISISEIKENIAFARIFSTFLEAASAKG